MHTEGPLLETACIQADMNEPSEVGVLELATCAKTHCCPSMAHAAMIVGQIGTDVALNMGLDHLRPRMRL